ncbi:MAG: 3-deoxy-manno-octulosonate cytidylyltransferase [Salinisphaeraceae bacterium]|nr:3-deoxy-manno-octulosonate cytidylyltransferase [Salinisphaeraceae bacterium]
MQFKVVIPARLASTRLPGKVLLPLAGKPLIEHVWLRACEAGADQVIIAADSEQIAEVATGFGAEVCLTAQSHESGTDRIHEVVSLKGWAGTDIVVNLQGDEPGMPPALIKQVAENLDLHHQADIATLCHAIASWEDWQNPGLVKVVRDLKGMAMYFSRAPIPHDRAVGQAGEQQLPAAGAWGHIGLYAYRVQALQRFSGLDVADLERCEALEQLRAMAHGLRIHVDEALEKPGTGVDTEDDLRRAEAEFLAVQ